MINCGHPWTCDILIELNKYVQIENLKKNIGFHHIKTHSNPASLAWHSSSAKQPKVEGAVFQVIWRAVEVENQVKDLVIRKAQSC